MEDRHKQADTAQRQGRRQRSFKAMGLIWMAATLGGCGGGGIGGESGAAADASSVAAATHPAALSYSAEECAVKYPDKLSAVARQQAAGNAQACGAPVAAADAWLTAARARCVAGDLAGATTQYASFQYHAIYAADTVASLCGRTADLVQPSVVGVAASASAPDTPAVYGLYVLYAVPVGQTASVIVRGNCADSAPPDPTDVVSTGRYTQIRYEQITQAQTLSQCLASAANYGLGAS